MAAQTPSGSQAVGSQAVPRGWPELGGAILEQIGVQTGRSPALRDVVQHGMLYLDTNNLPEELLFHSYALFMGVLKAGERRADLVQFQNSAMWFSEWFQQRQPMLYSTLPSLFAPNPDTILANYANGIPVRISVTVGKIVEEARRISLATYGTSDFEGRHFVAAMIMRGVAEKHAPLLHMQLSQTDLDDLKLFFIGRLMKTAGRDETRERWHSALNLPPPTGEEEQGGRDATAPWDADSVSAGPDVLDTEADARALARLMCLDDSAPMALAVFGAWGAGKSTFMERLEKEVKGIAAEVSAQAKKQTGEPPPGTAKFIGNVVQISFNAWQFADANLWASLTAEFFDQLRAGGSDRAGAARHSVLVERVGQHVHSLNLDLKEKRRAAAESGKQLAVAQQQRDAAAKDVDRADAKALGQAGVDLLGDIYEAEKHRLSALGLTVTGSDTTKAVEVVISAVAKSRSIFSQIAAVIKVVSKTPERLGVALLFLALFVAAAVAALAWGWGQGGFGQIASQVTAALMGVGALGAAANWLAPVLSLVGSVTRRGADIARAVDAANDKSTQTLLEAELKLREAAVEAKALKDAADQAQQRLSRYVDPEGASNPPRLLRFVLEDDPDTKALEKEVGLISRTRRLFQTVNDIVQTQRDLKKNPAPAPKEGEQKDPRREQIIDEEVPDRIVLYIDDLDRCTERQVYNVLQAVHLLLSFKLFVVVVGVDVDWVHGALARCIAHDDDTDEEKAERASRYLEKIFQAAFWLRPLSSEAEGSFSRYVRSLATGKKDSGTGGGLPVSRTGAQAATQGAVIEATSGVIPLSGVDTAARASTPGAEAKAAAEPPPIQLLSTIQLEEIEVEFLSSPEIGRVAATTPRAVKRLVNLYRLVRARLGETRRDIVGVTPLYPLIALAAAIETGKPTDIANSFFEGLAGQEPSQSMVHFTSEPLPAGVAHTDTAAGRLFATLRQAPEIRTALVAVLNRRAHQLTAKDLLDVLRLTRRYSFNRYL